jgi:hypothetical protein
LRSVIRALWAIAYLWLTGCSERKPIRAEIEVPRYCLESVALTENSECHGAEGQELHCTHLLLVKKTGCETIHAPMAPKLSSKPKETP